MLHQHTWPEHRNVHHFPTRSAPVPRKRPITSDALLSKAVIMSLGQLCRQTKTKKRRTEETVSKLHTPAVQIWVRLLRWLRLTGMVICSRNPSGLGQVAWTISMRDTPVTPQQWSCSPSREENRLTTSAFWFQTLIRFTLIWVKRCFGF